MYWVLGNRYACINGRGKTEDWNWYRCLSLKILGTEKNVYLPTYSSEYTQFPRLSLFSFSPLPVFLPRSILFHLFPFLYFSFQLQMVLHSTGYRKANGLLESFTELHWRSIQARVSSALHTQQEITGAHKNIIQSFIIRYYQLHFHYTSSRNIAVVKQRLSSLRLGWWTSCCRQCPGQPNLVLVQYYICTIIIWWVASSKVWLTCK